MRGEAYLVVAVDGPITISGHHVQCGCACTQLCDVQNVTQIGETRLDVASHAQLEHPVVPVWQAVRGRAGQTHRSMWSNGDSATGLKLFSPIYTLLSHRRTASKPTSPQPMVGLVPIAQTTGMILGQHTLET